MLEKTPFFGRTQTFVDCGVLPVSQFEKLAHSALDDRRFRLIENRGRLCETAIQFTIKFQTERSAFDHRPFRTSREHSIELRAKKSSYS